MQRSTPFKNETSDLIASFLKRIEALEKRVYELEENNHFAMQGKMQYECEDNKDIENQVNYLEQVRTIIERDEKTRFKDFLNPGQRHANQLGYIKLEEERKIFFIFPDMFKAFICRGFNPVSVARALKDAGALTMNGGSLQRSVRFPGGKPTKFYVIDGERLFNAA